MMIDFKENIELLEKIIFNFILAPDDNDVIIKPKNYDSLDKREIIPMVKAHYFNDDTLQRLYREAKKFFLEYKKVPTKNEIRELANQMHDAVQPYFPVTFKAWSSQVLKSSKFTENELEIISSALDLTEVRKNYDARTVRVLFEKLGTKE
jgi:hypothetical protein